MVYRPTGLDSTLTQGYLLDCLAGYPPNYIPRDILMGCVLLWQHQEVEGEWVALAAANTKRDLLQQLQPRLIGNCLF